MEFWIPYGETEVPIRVPDDNFYKILEPPRTAAKDPSALVDQALNSPVGGVSISSFGMGRAGLVVGPLVPPGIVEVTLEQLRKRITPMGIDSVTVFLRKHSSSASIVQSQVETVLVDSSEGPFVELGKTASGTPVEVRQDFHSCEVKISLGMVTPHFATGFTGGPEAILPGVCSLETETKNRSLLLKGTGPSDDNAQGPILTDTLDACKLVGPVLSISCVPDGSRGLESVFSGELEATFKEATSRYSQVHTARVDVRPDITVLAAGQVFGADLYHGVRVLPNAWNAAKRDGTLILAAECARGVGDESFLEFSRKFEDRKSLLTDLRHHFKHGGHVALLLKEAVERNRVQLVSVLPDHYVSMFNLKSARTASAAIQSSIRAEGKDARVLIVTRGDLTLPVFTTN